MSPGSAPAAGAGAPTGAWKVRVVGPVRVSLVKTEETCSLIGAKTVCRRPKASRRPPSTLTPTSNPKRRLRPPAAEAAAGAVGLASPGKRNMRSALEGSCKAPACRAASAKRGSSLAARAMSDIIASRSPMPP